MSDIRRKALIEEAKSIYTAWNWDMLEAEMESGYDRGAFRDLVTMYTKMVDHIESPSNQGEAARLREALKVIGELISSYEGDPFDCIGATVMKALSSHTEDAFEANQKMIAQAARESGILTEDTGIQKVQGIDWKQYDPTSREIESHRDHLVTNGHCTLIAQHASVPGTGKYSWMINNSLISWVTHYAKINLP